MRRHASLAAPFDGPSRRMAHILVLVLLSIMALLLIASVRQESQTFDESAHLFAGFEYWKHADFGRNPEHPPLAKFLVALPLLPMGLQEPPPVPIPYFKAQDFINASQFIYSADADAILFRGRLVIAAFSLLLGLLLFIAAQEMFGTLTGLVALTLYVFEPVMLANGALVTTDMPLACLFFAAVYAFYRYTNQPSPFRLILTAVVASLAIASKHSGLLILPTLFLLAIGDLLLSRRTQPESDTDTSRHHILRLAVALAVIVVVSYIGLWAIYGFRYAARPGQLTIVPPLAAYAAGLGSTQQATIGFLAHHHLLPEAYLYGWADILLIPSYRFSFLFGHVFASGRWFFFPALFLIKSTLVLLVLLALVPFARIREHRREFLFLVLPAAFFFLVAVISMVNLGIRHILAVYPFCMILAGAAAVSLATRSKAARVAVAAGLVFMVASSLHAFPDFLAYSNELAGGPAHTYQLTADNNADWGQGLKWIKTYLDRHPSPNCWIAYSNPEVPLTYYGIRCKPLLSGMAHAVGISSGIISPTISGTVLVSSIETSGLLWGPDSLNPYSTFRNRKPDDLIGNVVLVYRGTFDVPLLAAQTNAATAVGFLRQQQIPQALSAAQLAAAEAPQSAEINAVLGQTLLAAGRIPEGQQHLATALRLLQVDHPEFQKSLAQQLQDPQNHP